MVGLGISSLVLVLHVIFSICVSRCERMGVGLLMVVVLILSREAKSSIVTTYKPIN